MPLVLARWQSCKHDLPIEKCEAHVCHLGCLSDHLGSLMRVVAAWRRCCGDMPHMDLSLWAFEKVGGPAMTCSPEVLGPQCTLTCCAASCSLTLCCNTHGLRALNPNIAATRLIVGKCGSPSTAAKYILGVTVPTAMCLAETLTVPLGEVMCLSLFKGELENGA